MSSLFRASGKRKQLSADNKYGLHGQEKRITELESFLAKSYAEISDLKQRLAEQGENQSLSIKKLRRERDELRNKNATLVGKLAEVSRKQRFTPPVLPRILYRSSTSRLPSIPNASDFSEDNNGSIKGEVPVIEVTPTSELSQQEEGRVENSFPLTDESDTDYSDLEDELIEEVGMNKNMSTTMKLSDEEQIEWEIEKELSAVRQAATSSSTSSAIVFGYLKNEEVNAGWKKTSFSPSSSLWGRENQRHSTSSAEGRCCINGTAKKFPPTSSVKPRPLIWYDQNSQSAKKSMSSQNVASAIHKVLGKRMPVQDMGIKSKEMSVQDMGIKSKEMSVQDMGIKSKEISTQKPKDSVVLRKVMSMKDMGIKSKERSTPKDSGIVNSITKQGHGMVIRSQSVKVRSHSDSTSEADSFSLHSSMEMGGVAKTRAMFEKLSNHRSGGGSPVLIGRKESFFDAVLSSKEADTSMKTNLDVITPPASDSVVPFKSSPTSFPNLLTAKPDASKISKTFQRSKCLDDSNIDEQDDELSDMQSFGKVDMRSRTKTLSGMPVRGTSKVEIGRKLMKEHRRESYKLKQASEEERKGEKGSGGMDRVSMRVELEHLSPLLAAKIKGMSLRRIYNQYGGKIAVTSAVAVIEEAWRSYKLRKHFQERLCEMREHRMVQRKRASTLQRVPSILGMRHNFNSMRGPRGKVLDPAAKSKEKLAKDLLNRSYSRTRLEVLEKRQSSCDLQCVVEKEEAVVIAEEKMRVAEKSRENKLGSAVSVGQCDLQLDLEQCKVSDSIFVIPDISPKDDLSQGEGTSSGTPDDADGMADEFVSNSYRPVSVFSDCFVESANGYPVFSLDDGDNNPCYANTLPHLSRAAKASRRDRVDEFWLNIGIHHFNGKATKGIKYLVKNGLLDDDPKKVADFLIHQKCLSKEKIGEFLGEVNNEFNMAVLEALVRCVNIGDQPIDEALREFQQLFRMPGEAQKIDKIMEVFAREYHRRNEKLGIFTSEDGAYILSFSIMMLHTSLHNPSVKSRTSKKQWITMNRGINEGEDFPETFLLEIFDRIQATEFATGTDHTHVVLEIEKQIVGSAIQRLSTTQRYLVHKCNMVEVMELNVRPGFLNKHRRCIFFFNDIAVICKKKHHDLYLFKETFSLTNLLSVKFETSHYKYGVQLHAVDRETPYQFNCDSYLEREEILEHLDNISTCLTILESERIEVLGTSLSSQAMPDMSSTGCRSFDAGDLISSMNLSVSSSPSFQHRGGHFVSGVGDLAMAASAPSAFTRRHSSSNRVSQDSGFISQQLSPSPPQSPFLIISSTNAETDALVNGSTIAPSHTLPKTPNSSTPPTRSKSTETISRLTVSPLTPLLQSPSMEFMAKHRHQSDGDVLPHQSDASTSKKNKKKIRSDKMKDRGGSEKKNKGSIFNFSRTKLKDSSGQGGNMKEKLKQTMSLSREASPQPYHQLPQSMPNNTGILDEFTQSLHA